MVLCSAITFITYWSAFSHGSADFTKCPQGSVAHLCWSHSAVSRCCMQIVIKITVPIMPTIIQPIIIENIVQFSSLGLFQREMSRTIGVSLGAILKVLRCVRESSSLTQGLRGNLLHQKKIMSFYASWGGRVFSLLSIIRMELIRRTGCPVVFRMFQGHLTAAGYRPRLRDRCPRLTPDRRRCRHMLAHRHRNRNRQHSSHMLFADESIVGLYNCNGHARVFHCAVERLVDCCIQ